MRTIYEVRVVIKRRTQTTNMQTLRVTSSQSSIITKRCVAYKLIRQRHEVKGFADARLSTVRPTQNTGEGARVPWTKVKKEASCV